MPEEQIPSMNNRGHYVHGHISDFRPHHAAHVQRGAAHEPIRRAAAQTVSHHEQHHAAKPAPLNPSILQPTPVVKMWTTRGLEYAMMSVSLWVTALAFIWLLLNIINGRNSFSVLISPVSALIISAPVLSFFFIRLKMAEAKNPILRADPSRRRWTQLTQFLAYLVVLLTAIGLVHELLARYATSGSYSRPISKVVLDAVAILAVAAIILIYFWLDEHRPIRR